jgi:hypothetical protein
MLADFLRVLLRRWLWVVAAAVIAILGSSAVFIKIGPTQQATAELLLLPSTRAPGVDKPVNPFVGLDTSLSVVGHIIQVSVSNQATSTQLYQAGNRARYKIAPNVAQNSGPTLIVTVDDKSATMVEKTLGAVITEMKNSLNQIQLSQDIPSAQYISLQLLTASPHATPVRKSQIQSAFVTGVGLFGCLVALILLVERIRARKTPPVNAADQRVQVPILNGHPINHRDVASEVFTNGSAQRGPAARPTPIAAESSHENGASNGSAPARRYVAMRQVRRARASEKPRT